MEYVLAVTHFFIELFFESSHMAADMLFEKQLIFFSKTIVSNVKFLGLNKIS